MEIEQIRRKDEKPPMEQVGEPPAGGFSSFIQRRETQPSGYRNSPSLNSSSSDDSNASDDEDDDSMMWRSKRQRHSRQIAACGDNKPFFNPNRETLNSPPRPVRMPSKNSDAGFKRNNIWGSVLQEQTVTEGLNRGIKVDRASDSESEESDNVESYNYKMARKDNRPHRQHSESEGEEKQDSIHNAVEKETFGNAQHNHRKRPHHSRRNGKPRGNVKERLGERTYDKEKPRPHIDVTAEDSVPKIVNCLCNVLDEPKVDLMTRVVDTLGNQKAMELLYMTEDVEEAGGLMTLDGSRRRTPGGTYLQLMRTDPKVTSEQVKEIFKEERQQFVKRKKQNKRRRRERVQNMFVDKMQEMEEDVDEDSNKAHQSQGSLNEGTQPTEVLKMEMQHAASQEPAASAAAKDETHPELEDGELEDGEIPD